MHENKKSTITKRLIVLDYVIAFIFIVGLLYMYDVRTHSVAVTTSTISPLSVMVARTEAERELGLGNRASLPADEGMLFVFDTPSGYGFWMKDMSFPIDIISLDNNFVVTHIESNVSPLTYPEVFLSPANTLYVLEANAGYAAKNNLRVGDTLAFLKQAVNQ